MAITPRYSVPYRQNKYGLSTAEIAAEMGCSEHAVRILLSRALAKLRRDDGFVLRIAEIICRHEFKKIELGY